MNPNKKPPLVPGGKGGLIFRGGVPGNRGGKGRPAIIRAKCRKGFEKSLDSVVQVAAGEKLGDQQPTIADRVKAWRLLTQHGLKDPEILVAEEFREILTKLVGIYVPLEKQLQALQLFIDSAHAVAGQEPLDSCDPSEANPA